MAMAPRVLFNLMPNRPKGLKTAAKITRGDLEGAGVDPVSVDSSAMNRSPGC